jgi:hypothetical protein
VVESSLMRRGCFTFLSITNEVLILSESGRDPVGFSFMRFNVKVLYFMR